MRWGALGAAGIGCTVLAACRDSARTAFSAAVRGEGPWEFGREDAVAQARVLERSRVWLDEPLLDQREGS